HGPGDRGGEVADVQRPPAAVDQRVGQDGVGDGAEVALDVQHRGLVVVEHQRVVVEHRTGPCVYLDRVVMRCAGRTRQVVHPAVGDGGVPRWADPVLTVGDVAAAHRPGRVPDRVRD